MPAGLCAAAVRRLTGSGRVTTGGHAPVALVVITPPLGGEVGLKCEIQDSPVTVGLVVEHSGSGRRKLLAVLAAARTFAQASHPQEEVFVVDFLPRAR